MSYAVATAILAAAYSGLDDALTERGMSQADRNKVLARAIPALWTGTLKPLVVGSAA